LLRHAGDGPSIICAVETAVASPQAESLHPFVREGVLGRNLYLPDLQVGRYIPHAERTGRLKKLLSDHFLKLPDLLIFMKV
jgi:hypothetical protein